MKRTSLALMMVAGAILLAAAQTASAAGYIRFDGIDGDVARGDHKNWCNLVSVSNPLSPPKPPLAPAPAGVAKGGPGRIVVVKKVDKATPLLKQAAAKGTLLPSVDLDVASSDPGAGPYLHYKLERCFIKSWSTSGGADAGRPSAAGTETFTLEYSGIALHYAEQKAPKEPPVAASKPTPQPTPKVLSVPTPVRPK